jgi:hypothetical protein
VCLISCADAVSSADQRKRWTPESSGYSIMILVVQGAIAVDEVTENPLFSLGARMNEAQCAECLRRPWQQA